MGEESYSSMTSASRRLRHLVEMRRMVGIAAQFPSARLDQTVKAMEQNDRRQQGMVGGGRNKRRIVGRRDRIDKDYFGAHRRQSPERIDHALPRGVLRRESDDEKALRDHAGRP